MKNKKLILATDLDGTFLEGAYHERAEFYRFLAQARDDIAVVFVTGRTLGLIKQLYQSGLDFFPDYIIADHGTVVVRGDNFDCVLSHDVYLDILPKEVGKSTTLGKLMDHMGCSGDRVITCGDSLNDLPLFEMGYRSIAVGNSEKKLINTIENMEHVFLSKFPGVSGIIDGLKFYQEVS